MKTYITFGQDHTRTIDGKTIDKDCVVVLESNSQEEGRNLAFELFGPKFCFEYPEKHWYEPSMKYYPRGYIAL